MTDEEAMEALLNSDGYSFPTWTLKLGLPTDEMRDVMSLIASDKAPIPVDVAYISEYLHMDGAVVESSVKELLVIVPWDESKETFESVAKWLDSIVYEI